MSHPLNEELVDTLRRHQAQAQARVRALRAQSKAGAPREDAAVQQQQAEGMEHRRQEYLVKWRSMSYRHAQWVPAATVQVLLRLVVALPTLLWRLWKQHDLKLEEGRNPSKCLYTCWFQHTRNARASNMRATL
eukprot:1160747-Pelagomonas_calceolata.AAC.5